MFGAGASVGVAMAAFTYTNGLVGWKKDEDVDEVERRETQKKLRRRPLEETIEQLGEGRGKNLRTIFDVLHATEANMCRNICSRIRREEARKVASEVRRRCRRGTRSKIDSHTNFLESECQE